MSDEDDKKSSPQDSEDYTSMLEKQIESDINAMEMEEFYLKVQVDLENALTDGGDFLHILEDVYSHSHPSEDEEQKKFEQFGLFRSQKTEEIVMVTCFKDSGRPLFEICLSDKASCQTSLSFILNAMKNYVKHKLGELIEELSLESQTIHFFVIEEKYIFAIVTTKQIIRDRIGQLAVQIVTIMKRYSEESLRDSNDFTQEVLNYIASLQASFVKEHHTLKIILIGDGAVGKTSIRRQYLGEGFKNDYQMTIGADLASKESPVLYSGGRQVKYLIWDLAGQPRFEGVRKAYYMSAMGAIVVFDTTRVESFQNIVGWMNEFWKLNGRGPVPIIILGNKADLRDEGVMGVSDAKARKFARTLSHVAREYRGFDIHYLPTSAKTGLNINLAFELLGEAVMDFFESTKKL
ncbi:MAG: Rab family GTPase [Candidatus Hodarchaeales archaeon]|jgi:small GTP-binding protein